MSLVSHLTVTEQSQLRFTFPLRLDEEESTSQPRQELLRHSVASLPRQRISWH